MYKKLMFACLLLAGCTKYGPDSASAPSESAGADGAVASRSEGGLAAFKAAPYSVPAALKDGMRCDLNSVAGQGLEPAVPKPVSRAAGVMFNGWVVNGGENVPELFLIVLKGEHAAYSIPAVAGVARPDVATALNNPSLEQAGYAFEADIRDVEAGRYSVELVEPKASERCDTTKVIEIAAE